MESCVVRDQTEAAHIALQMQHQRVVTGAVVGLEHVDVGHNAWSDRWHSPESAGNERSEQICAAGVGEGAVAVIALLVDVIGADQPVLVESVLHAARDVNGVGRLVIGADEIAGSACAASQAARPAERICAGTSSKAAGSRGEVRVVDALKCRRPSVLREIVIVDAKPGANYGFLAAAGRVSDAETRRDLFVIIVRHAGHDRNLQRLQRLIRGIVGLASSRPMMSPQVF